MRLIDLSSTIDANAWEVDGIRHEVLTPADGARHMAEGMLRDHGLEFDVADLPDGELLSLDTLTLTTHTGTHVDAPSHYGSRAAYGVPRHIDELPLEWFIGPGVRLDLTDCGVGTVGVDRLRRAFDEIDHRPSAGEIVLLHTGAERLAGTPEYFTRFAGLDGAATNLLLDLGVRLIGTDAFGLDAPFTHMLAEFQRTRDRSVLWPAHFAGRQREYCQIERLSNLGALPAPTGFTVQAFPVKIAGAGAGWTRAVALLD
ncbi:cyclase family protein [Kitasatospora aureofaciens]|uniref:CtcD n=1 Tax=Kitasatospora aureofaciens TaxID=1894 RepID=S4S398_KITAU|nr:cyclase family protein [Kitasatospora aureofaciens]QEV01895.1 cyclase family protein [Streptomyces viridifaciens]AEI98647.1 CtcD [Kitasatospora aureofaciens]ARF80643.1 cyclase [Kitasatospora aureofaciens]OEV33540.1 cyclase [Kitasatospora aureofaciens]UKZ08355.1 cyclase family protein [Streptomyces viridifaciens]